MQPAKSIRIDSIDILRALTMLLMIFVNDLWSLKDIPGWLEHTEADYDGMGLADTVFPAFLFIVGMSIPFAVNNRRAKGDSNSKIIWHIIERSIALLIMGLFLVNGEHINEAATGMKRGLWNTLSCFSFILLWNIYPKTMNRRIIWLLKAIAIANLLALAWIYRAGEADKLHGFATYWWGILGLIGWAYLVSAIIYALSGNKLYINLIAWIVFLVLCMANHAHWIPRGSILSAIIAPIGGGAMPAFTMGGVVTSLIFLHYHRQNKQQPMMGVLFGLAVILCALGFLTRPLDGISKIRATPSWVLICSAITIVMFLIIYWLADMKKKAHWFKIIEPAGNNTLLVYLLPYFAYALVVLLHVYLPDVLLTSGIGLIKSFLFALLIIIIAGWLGRLGLRLKL